MSSQSIVTLNANQTEGLLGTITNNRVTRVVSRKRKLLLAFIFPQDSAAVHEDSIERPRIRTPTDPEGASLSKQVLGKKYAAIDSSGMTSIPMIDFETSEHVELSASSLNDMDAFMQSIHTFMTDCYKRTPHANPNYLQETLEGFRTLFALNPKGLCPTCAPTSVFLVDYHQLGETQLVFPVDLIGHYLDDQDLYSASEWKELQGKAMVLQLTRKDGTTYKLKNWGTYKTRKYANIYLNDASDVASGKYGNGSLTESNRGEFVDVQSLISVKIHSVWQWSLMCIHRLVRFGFMGFVMAILLYMCAVVIFNHHHKRFRLFKLRQPRTIQRIYNALQRDNDVYKNTQHNTQHRWNESISPTIQRLIRPLNTELIRRLGADYSYVPAMTELYWSSQENKNSDQQYVSTHNDGPFYYCDLQRVLVMIRGNQCIHTHFPTGNAQYTLQSGDAMAFHYDNSLHYISVDSPCDDTSPRIMLKLHYVRTPLKRHCSHVHCSFGPLRVPRTHLPFPLSDMHQPHVLHDIHASWSSTSEQYCFELDGRSNTHVFLVCFEAYITAMYIHSATNANKKIPPTKLDTYIMSRQK